ncbi:DUF1963 domain-containing protein [Actinomadura sp. DC4]|uniref:DUF1963 domain-containing protein n=1 Tax=Actinomadura sp. DC4 TaxID=3055069 RepID=UPI0025AFA450|nr:DUF1963 domain-containing protein [Actinomadura sp. DC4]MDN3354185.1 DUF1963 domain-containing protein [Actinomadura sp. DC4]
MTYAGKAEACSSSTRIGGMPLMPVGFSWPTCATCARPMQFVAQLLLQDLSSFDAVQVANRRGMLSIFMCQNDPGLCSDWDPASGGNRALLFPDVGLVPAAVPAQGNTLLPDACRIEYTKIGVDGYDEARNSWCRASDRPLPDVLGQLGGIPSWLQGDETQSCPSCAQPMTFVAQFEEGNDLRAAANFGGGGCGYSFACSPCQKAAFLWQC